MVLCDHHVVRLDVAVYDTNDLVTVLYCPQHVDEVMSCLASRDTACNHLIQFAFDPALVVVIFVLMIHAVHDITKTSLCIVFSHEVDVTVQVVDDLVQPKCVRMVQLLQDLKLFHD